MGHHGIFLLESYLIILIDEQDTVSYTTHARTDLNDDKYERSVFSFGGFILIYHPFAVELISVAKLWVFSQLTIDEKTKLAKQNHQH